MLFYPSKCVMLLVEAQFLVHRCLFNVKDGLPLNKPLWYFKEAHVIKQFSHLFRETVIVAMVVIATV